MASFESGDISQLAFLANTAAVTSFIAYTVPADKKTLILEIRSNNVTSTTHEIVLGGAATLRLVVGATLLSFQGKLVLAATETVTITKASSNDVRTIVIGIEVDA